VLPVRMKPWSSTTASQTVVSCGVPSGFWERTTSVDSLATALQVGAFGSEPKVLPAHRTATIAIHVPRTLRVYPIRFDHLPMQSFAALSDPTRRRIVELLSRGERSAGEIVAEFEMSAPAISQHLRTLREAGLVRVRVDAQRRIYALERAALDEIDAWLAEVRRFWSKRLDALERELRRKPVTTRRKR